MNFYNFLRIPLSSRDEKKEEKVSAPSLRREVQERLDRGKPFSMVYVQIKEGEFSYICGLVNGLPAAPNCLGVLTDSPEQVYETLDKLVEAPFASSLSVGTASFDPSNDIVDVFQIPVAERMKNPQKYRGFSFGDLLVRAQKKFDEIKYEGQVSKACQEQPSPLYPLPVPA